MGLGQLVEETALRTGLVPSYDSSRFGLARRLPGVSKLASNPRSPVTGARFSVSVEQVGHLWPFGAIQSYLDPSCLPTITRCLAFMGSNRLSTTYNMTVFKHDLAQARRQEFEGP